MNNIIQNGIYKVKGNSHYCDNEFKYVVVMGVGSHVSDCEVVNIHGESKPGLEFAVPINNSELEELSYRELNSIRPF